MMEQDRTTDRSLQSVDVPRHIAEVRRAIETACEQSGRDLSEIRLIAVTKSADVPVLKPLYDAGIVDFAENRWPDARAKLEYSREVFPAAPPIWHFIGRLQLNKVKYVVPRFDWIHSLDSIELAAAISARATSQNRTISCLVQVNVSGEETKAGLDPSILPDFLENVRELPGVQICGLMTMAPNLPDIEMTRPVFRSLRQLLVDTRHRLSMPSLQELSMGMSNDFEVAIEEGATLIRVGRRLVGERT